MDFELELASRVEYVNSVIEKYFPEETGFQKTIFEAMNYSVQAGGKRLRPILMAETFKLFGGEGEVIKPFMAGIEMIHTYSLVHDDLPAMDNDEYRRGKKTTHAKFGEAMGILAGDALLNYAYETVSEAGQVVDVESEKKPEVEITREKLDFIYKLKTGALIECSMMVGAILAGASDEEVKKIEQIASKIGLAFQIQDDILDVTSSLEVLGKPIGSDEKNSKMTYVAFEGLEKSAVDVDRISREACNELKSFNRNDEFLQNLFVYLIHREK